MLDCASGALQPVTFLVLLHESLDSHIGDSENIKNEMVYAPILPILIIHWHSRMPEVILHISIHPDRFVAKPLAGLMAVM